MKICERRCPHCGYGGPKGAPTAAAVLLGLALGGCTSSAPEAQRKPASEVDRDEAIYGVPRSHDHPPLPEVKTSPSDAKQPEVRIPPSRR